MRILLIKNHSSRIKLTKQIVKAAFPGARFDVIANDAPGWQQLKHGSYDLCLLDLLRSNLSNCTTLITQVTQTQAAIPILFLTSQNNYHTLKCLRCLTQHAQAESSAAEHSKSHHSPMYECLPNEQMTPQLIKRTYETLIKRPMQRKWMNPLPARTYSPPLQPSADATRSSVSDENISHSISSLRVFIDNLIEVTTELSTTKLTQQQLTYVNNILYDSQCVSRSVYWLQHGYIEELKKEHAPFADDKASKQGEFPVSPVQTTPELITKPTPKRLRLNHQLDQSSEIARPPLRVLIAGLTQNDQNTIVKTLYERDREYQVLSAPEETNLIQRLQAHNNDLLLLDTTAPECHTLHTVIDPDTLNLLMSRNVIAAFTFSTKVPMSNAIPNAPILRLFGTLIKPTDTAELQYLLTKLERQNREHVNHHRLAYQSILTKKLPNFLQRSNTLLMDIQTAVFNQDVQALETAAHTFKGLAASFQFHQMAEICETLEHMAEQHDLSGSEPHIIKLHQQLTGIHTD